jgi:predicted short-subunit dehydrogenase-like oxidoreductase (DUF2520 family)
VTHQVAVHTPVTAGHSDALRSVIAALPTGAASPLASLPSTHYARLVVADGVRGEARLVFSAVTDVSEAEYLDAVVTTTGDLPERLWSHCSGWPGAADSRAAIAYLRDHVVRPTLPFATWDASLERIRDGLKLRRRLIDFAPRVQDLGPAARLAAFRQEFGD